jgi:hypothetical protein
MRDCDHCTPAHQARKRFTNRLLGFAIERGPGFVEHRIGASFRNARAIAMRNKTAVWKNARV